MFPIPNFFRLLSILLILSLFTIGSLPSTGQAFPGNLHWAVHLSTYALITFSCSMGWQKIPIVHVALLVATIGFIHELTEIITHSHGFEYNDALVNLFGALTGMAITILIRRSGARTSRMSPRLDQD